MIASIPTRAASHSVKSSQKRRLTQPASSPSASTLVSQDAKNAALSAGGICSSASVSSGTKNRQLRSGLKVATRSVEDGLLLIGADAAADIVAKRSSWHVAQACAWVST